MKRFLLFVGSLPVGFAVLLSLVSILSSPDGQRTYNIMMSLTVTGVAVAFGMALSAPYALDPPDDGGGWWIRLPIFLALALLIIRGVSFVGTLVLVGAWRIVFALWRLRPGASQQAIPGYAPAPGTSVTPPSWQPDPSGRYLHRYWDGTAWTQNVSNGGAASTDPLTAYRDDDL